MKKIVIALALCLVMVGLMAAPVFAATQRVDLMKCAEPDPIKAGYATFTTNQGDNALVVRITVTNATARTKYEVHLMTECAEDYILGYLKTNSKGKWGGQNEQYEFVKVLSVGEHEVSLRLIPILGGSPSTEPKDWIVSSPVTVNITGN